MAVKRRRESPFRYFSLWLFNTPLFWHYHELCVSSFPSPLDEKAPPFASAILLAIAGLYEYFAHLGVSAVFALLFCLLRKLILMEPRRSNPNMFVLRKRDKFSDRWLADPMIDSQDLFFWLQGTSLQLILLASFWFRRKAFSHSLLRKYPEIANGASPRLFGFARLLLWFNPGLLYHVAVLYHSRYYFGGHKLLVLHILTWYLQILAPPPALDVGKQSPSRERTALGAVLVVAWPLLYAYIAKSVLKQIPRLMIAVTLKCQNRTYSDSERHVSTSSKKRGPRKLVYQVVCQSALNAIAAAIDFAFSIFWRICAVIYLSTVKHRQRAFDRSRHSADAKMGLPQKQAPSTTSIRLLRIRPGVQNDPVECSLQWYDTKSLTKIPYAAVSYSWGSDIRCQNVTVNGKAIMVTQSAFDVLKGLRFHHSSNAIWMDAICIDQDSPADKTQQIPLMPTIYRGAAKTVVWLGHSPTADLAMALIKRAFLLDRINKLMGKTWTRLFFPTFEISRASAAALRDMLDLSWFHRAWVVQEIVRSENVVVTYGSASIPWQRLSWFTEALLRNNAQLLMINQRCKGKLPMDALRNIQTMDRFALISAERESLSLLFYLVQMFRGTSRFKAKEKEDRIYALLGLLNEQNSIQPDYNKTDTQRYIEIAHHHLSNAPNPLDLLVHAGIGHRDRTCSTPPSPSSSPLPPLPSWVPDWSLNPAALPIIGTDGLSELLSSSHVTHVVADATSFLTYGTNDLLSESDARRSLEVAKDTALAALFKAGCKGEKTLEYHAVSDGVLETRGHVVDEINCIGEACSAPNIKTPSDMHTLLLILSDWARMVRQVCAQHPYYTGTSAHESREVAFVRTLFNDFEEPEVDLTFTTTPTRVVVTDDAAAGIFHFLCNFPPSLQEARRTPDDPAHDVLKIFAKYAPMWMGKVFGLTKKGYFGLFLEGTRAGDEVVVVYGVRVPLSIRLVTSNNTHLKERRHELVGPAYVHGVMDGEVMATGKPAAVFRLQ